MSWLSKTLKKASNSISKRAGTIAGAGLGYLSGGWSGALAGGLGASGQYDANQANSAQSLRQMEFQERMSNTSHQREVKDLRKAGLNPMLSVNAGASSPGGAQAVMKNETESGINSALVAAQIDNIHAQTGLTKAQTSSIKPKTLFGDFVGSTAQNATEFYRHIKKSYNSDHSKSNYKHNSIHKNRGKINRSAVAYPTEGKGSKSTPLNPQHAAKYNGKQNFDYNPKNSHGKHYWTRRGGWMTKSQLDAFNKSTQSKWN